MIWSRVSH